MSILSVDQIQPIGSGTTITLNATEVKTGTEITVGTGASIFSPAGNTLVLGTNNVERLRITNDGTYTVQTGGSERLRIDSSGRLLVGTNSSSSSVRAVFQGYSGGGDNFQARVQFQTNQATDLASGNHLANLLFTNASNSVGAQIDVKADAAWGTNDYPARIEFKTTADGANSPTERLRIGSAGQIGIAGANYGTAGQVLTSQGSGSAVTWSAIPAQVTIANNADNRVITGGSGVNLNGEAGLTYNGQALNVNSVTSENNAFRVYNTTTSATTFQINGEGNSFIGHTYPRSDANLDLGYHSGYRWRDVVLSGGIRFGSNSSDDYLDDYEEGNYDVSITGSSGGSIGMQGNINNLRYTRIGRMVHVTGRIYLNSSSNPSGTARMSLPFTSSANTNDQNGQGYSYVTRYNVYNPNSDYNLIFEIEPNQSYGFFLWDRPGASWAGVDAGAELNQTACYLGFDFTYTTAT